MDDKNADPLKCRKYTPSKLRSAINDVRTGRLKVLEACRIYNIPRTTLYFKLSGGRPEEFCRPGPSAILGLEVETKIESWLMDNYKRGFSLSKSGLMYSVKKIIEQYPEHVRHKLPFKNNMPGRKWFASFKTRHPKIVEKLSEHKYLTKVNVTDAKVRTWYANVKSLIDEESASEVIDCPDRIYYIDEMCMFVNNKGELSFTDKRKAAYNASHSYVDNVTILFAANATGSFAPPSAVYKLKSVPSDNLKHVPSHWSVGFTKSGWNNCETFYEYMTGTFYPFLIKSSTQFPVIVFLDGNFSSMSLPLSSFCEEHGIVLLCTLPKSIHYLQPLHGFFSLIRTVWKNELKEWMSERKEEEDTTDCPIPPLIDSILEKKIFESTVVDGFRLCRLFPFEIKPEDSEDMLLPSEMQTIDAQKPCDCNLSVIEYVESKIPAEILTKFHACKMKNLPWTGYVGYSALYDLWTEILTENGIADVKPEETPQLILLEPECLEQFVVEEEIEESPQA